MRRGGQVRCFKKDERILACERRGLVLGFKVGDSCSRGGVHVASFLFFILQVR